MALNQTPMALSITEQAYKKGIEEFTDLHVWSWNSLIQLGVVQSRKSGDQEFFFVHMDRFKPGDEQLDHTALMTALFEKYGSQIRPWNRDTIWTAQELQEGWAQLYPDPPENLTDKQ